MDLPPLAGRRTRSRRTRSELPPMESSSFEPSAEAGEGVGKATKTVSIVEDKKSPQSSGCDNNRSDKIRKRAQSRRTKSELPAIKSLLLSAYDHAENKVVSIVEDQRQESNAHNGEWNLSVQGEKPPLGRLPLGANVLSSDTEGMPSIQDLALRVKLNSATEHMASMRNVFTTNDKEDSEDVFAQDSVDTPHQTIHTDAFISGAQKVNELFKEDDSISPSVSSSMATDTEGEPLLPTTAPASTYGSASNLQRKRKVKKRRKISQFWCLPKDRYSLAEIVNPEECRKSLLRLLLDSGITYIVLPCLLVAFILFYGASNVELDFMPGSAPVSWWLLFVARQALTLEMAIVLQHLVVEGLALRTKWLVLAFGPLVTLGIIQAKGWPLVTILWSIIDLCLLHGPHTFQQNWLYFLRVGLFSQKGDFLQSEFYLGLLLSMLLAGTCHAVKRTTVALSFGKRTLVQYKARMEKILTDIVLITEVAQLAKELLNLETEQAQQRVNPVVKKDNKWDVKYTTRSRDSKKGTNQSGDILNSMDSLHAENNTNNGDDDDTDEDHSSSSSSGLNDESDDTDDSEDSSKNDNSKEGRGESMRGPVSAVDKGSCVYSSQGDNPTDEQSPPVSADRITSPTKEIPPTHVKRFGKTDDPPLLNFPDLSHQPQSIASPRGVSSEAWSTGTRKIKRSLERWEDPENKLDKVIDASIADILKFRKALTYMDEPNPFGLSFGPAATRDECIKSAQKTYRRLLRYSDQQVLDYNILDILAISERGDVDEQKERALQRLFRPDSQNQVSLLAFVQTCDSTYKKIRFFRASVGNSSVINQVLESVVDGVVNFALVLVTLSMLKFNPLPVLVSLSTVMVSLAFAVGSSASKYIEGVLLIAVRRPYDIGDRIMANQPHMGTSPGLQNSWIVQDINLWSTTLRFSGTNEVATVNNGSLSALRIVNCNRSPNAMISLVMMFRLAEINREKIQLFKQSIESYVQDRRRLYHGLVSLRCNEVSTVNGSATYDLDVRHRRSWQDISLVMQTRAELMWHCMKVSQELGMAHDMFVPSVKVITVKNNEEEDVEPIHGQSPPTRSEANSERGLAPSILGLSS